MLWPDLLRSNGGKVTITPQIDVGLQAQLELARQVQLLAALDTFSLQKEIDNIGKR